MGRTVRVNISVPIELKARMEAVAEDMNWSAVACRAFEQALAEIIARQGAKDFQDAVTRLRASKRTTRSGRYKDGFALGQDWAKSTAEAEELERLEDFRVKCTDHEWGAFFDRRKDDAYGPCGHLLFVISPDSDGDRHASRTFWEETIGDELVAEDLMWKGDFVRGFAEGALAVWGEVKRQL
jgi:hypothetical protein